MFKKSDKPFFFNVRRSEDLYFNVIKEGIWYGFMGEKSLKIDDKVISSGASPRWGFVEHSGRWLAKILHKTPKIMKFATENPSKMSNVITLVSNDARVWSSWVTNPKKVDSTL